MSRKLRIWLPPVFALLVLAVPLRDLAHRLSQDPGLWLRGTESTVSRDDPVGRETVRGYGTLYSIPTANSGLSDIPDLPGKIIREQSDNTGRRLVITADAGETTEILETLYRNGSARTLTLFRTEKNWEVRMDLVDRQRRELNRDMGYPRDQVAAILGIRNASGNAPVRTGDSAAVAAAATVDPFTTIAAQQQAGTTPGPDAGSFGMVLFRSGSRLRWRWERDVLVLEEN